MSELISTQSTETPVIEQSQEAPAPSSAVKKPETAASEAAIVQRIPINRLKPFQNHAFRVYKGDKLERLVESIKVNDLIHHIVIRPIGDAGDFEIISGHNRMEAARQLGWTDIPAVVRNLNDDEAIIFANEANVTQRMFDSWLPSEKSKSIYQYHSTIKRQGARSDLGEGSSGDNHQKPKDHYAREKTARVYGVSENTVRLYLELYGLTEHLTQRLDNGEFGTTPAQALSRIAPEGQELIHAVLDEHKTTCSITVANARKARDLLKNYGGSKPREQTKMRSDLVKILSSGADAPVAEASPLIKTIEMESSQYELLFHGKAPDDVVADIIEAVEQFYNNISQLKTQGCKVSE